MAFYWVGAAWLMGLALGPLTRLETWQWLALAAGGLLAAYALRRSAMTRSLFVLLFFLCLGAARRGSASPDLQPNSPAAYNDLGAPLELRGVVVADPDFRDRDVNLRVAVDRLRLPGESQSRAVDGLVLIQAPMGVDWRYGDRLRAYGELQTPPESPDFSYRGYLARQGVLSLMPYASVERIGAGRGNPILSAIYALRRRLLAVNYHLFPDPEASLMAGILLGVERGISPEVRAAFNATGTTHIIAISGFNIAIIAGLFNTLARRWFGARRGAAAAALGILIYTILVGADPPVVRAAIMAGLALMAHRLGRPAIGLNTLALTAIGMTLFDPGLVADVSFQLSFAATLGLMLYSEPLKRGFTRFAARWLGEAQAGRIAGPVAEFGLYTLAAQVMTFPLTLVHFQRISFSSLLANPVILPFQPALMVLGGLAVLTGALFEPLGQLLAWIAWPFPAFTIKAVAFFAQLPLSSMLIGPTSVVWIALYYLILFGATAILLLPEEKRPFLKGARQRRALAEAPSMASVLLLGAAAMLTWRAAAQRPDGLLHVWILDVGGGDAVLVQTPDGDNLLIDGGSSPMALAGALGERLTPFNRRIDWLIVAGTASDQIGGLRDLPQRYPTGAALLAGKGTGARYGQLLEALQAAGVPAAQAEAGQRLALGQGAWLEVMAVGKRGAMLQLSYGSARMVSGAGLDPDLAAELASSARITPVTAYLLPDGGALAVNPPQLLARLAPQVAVLSLRTGGREGRPSPEVLQALAGRTLLRTDRNGWLHLATDGQHLWVETAKAPAQPP